MHLSACVRFCELLLYELVSCCHSSQTAGAQLKNQKRTCLTGIPLLMWETSDEQSLIVQHVIVNLWFLLLVICNFMRLNFQSILQIELQVLKSQASVHQPGPISNPAVFETPKNLLLGALWGDGFQYPKGNKMLPFRTGSERF